MSQVWYVIPVAESPEEANPQLLKWRELGYKVLIQVDPGAKKGYEADQVHERPYISYPEAVNFLSKVAVGLDGSVVVTGGTDIDPHPGKTAREIEQEFLKHFPDTFGVMQPTGDPWGMDKNGVPAAARICGSPWMGREFILRINQGKGPFWPEYFHFFCDEEMKEVTEGRKILWQRPDLTHFHNHWSRRRLPRPQHLNRARLNWDKAKKLFLARKAAGFPGSEPL